MPAVPHLVIPDLIGDLALLCAEGRRQCRAVVAERIEPAVILAAVCVPERLD